MHIVTPIDKAVNMKLHRMPLTFISLIMLLMIKSISGCSIYCEDGKIPCGGYGPTCEGFKGCTFPDECNTKYVDFHFIAIQMIRSKIL